MSPFLNILSMAMTQHIGRLKLNRLLICLWISLEKQIRRAYNITENIAEFVSVLFMKSQPLVSRKKKLDI